MAPRLLYEFLLGVASARNDHWLGYVVLAQVLADAIGGLVAIHYWHRAVHEYQAVLLAGCFHADVCCLDHVEGGLTVESLVDDLLDVVEAHLSQLGGQTQNVVRLVIHDQDALLNVKYGKSLSIRIL